ncbi:laminin subunit alpha-1 isoform X1 [Malaya genurostris]|uniref:laminin subunit alpha-1 isoform X1 n=1 Tax=Malaya genurostris TaxID=325434 RepID=UPI0026F3FC13|nr:laminin subunit alpha-1 isoform X1 [Malaya genurostris]XP_058446854.1 laminin subunit alpha-1 isoform X1 [Malaya genurostris]
MWSISDLVMAILGTFCLLVATTSGKLGRDDVDIDELRRLDDLDGYQRDEAFFGADKQDDSRIAQPLRHRNGRMRIGQLRRGGHKTRHFKHDLKLLSGLTSSTAVDPEYGFQKATGLWPSFFNVAMRATISVNATCGQNGKEEYCRLQDPLRSRSSQCGICDANNSDLEKRHPITNIVDGTNSWWQSPTLHKSSKNDRVTISLDLGQIYQVVFFTLRAAISPLPASWALEKSTDGKVYGAWQYFAADDDECRERFGLPAHTANYIFKNDSEVICSTQFSSVDPLETGEINLSLITGRPSEKTTSQELLNFTLARYIRIRLVRMHMLVHRDGVIGEGVVDTQAQAKRSFYTIRSLRIGGRCFCSGHAGKCKANDNNIDNMPRCECMHNTCGTHCDRCCPLYNQRPYRMGTPLSAHKCEKCECNGHSKECYYDREVDEQGLSMNIRGKLSGGGVCLNCTRFTTGINCEKCLPGYFRPLNRMPDSEEPCLPCECSELGSTGECSPFGGECVCKEGFTGLKCTECKPGYRGEECTVCPCDIRGTVAGGECDSSCQCKLHVEGDRCDRCSPGYFSLGKSNPEGCIKCFCSGIGQTCESSQQLANVYETLEGWSVTDISKSVVAYPTRDNETGFMVFGMFELSETESVYWSAPQLYLGNRLQSYGSKLSFKMSWVIVRGDTSGKPTTGPSVILFGKNGLKIAYGDDTLTGHSNATIDITLKEENWYHVPKSVKDIITRLKRTEYHGDPVTRMQFMSVLSDVESILLRGTYHTDQVESVLELAALYTGRSASETVTDQSLVEQCDCPVGYAGLSCEKCAFGFVRIYENTITHENIARCIPCTMCNGHAEDCNLETGECGLCHHNTFGDNCERCLPGFYGNALVGKSDDCKKCACPLEDASNNFSPSCQLKGAVGLTNKSDYVCTQCPEGYTGDHCEICDDGYYGNPLELGSKCLPCPCHGGPCNVKTGECIECLGNTEGWRCERCKSGHWGVPDEGCEPCSCSSVGALENLCDVITGQCICKPRYGGRLCDQCESGYGNLGLDCPACECHTNGSESSICDKSSGQCACKLGSRGVKCDQCAEEFFGLSDEYPGGCEACNCHIQGSVKRICNQHSGQCVCKPFVEGRQCNRCKTGYWNVDSGVGCVQCTCDSNGSDHQECDAYTGQCFCKIGVEGTNCDRCQQGYYGFSSHGCKRCEQCASPAYVCDPDTGRCVCPPNSHGHDCRSCVANTWGNVFQRGCQHCECDITGSIGQSCNGVTGQCNCKEGYTGRQCNECANGYYQYPNCHRCDCDEQGAIAQPDGSRDCDDNGQCLCKSMVFGRTCDQCKSATFGLALGNPDGCTRCFCFGRSQDCEQSELSWGQIRLQGSRNLSVEYVAKEEDDFDFDYVVVIQLDGTKTNREDAEIKNMNNLDLIPSSTGNVSIGAYSAFQYPLYFQLPSQFLGDRTTSYGGLLNFSLVTVGAYRNIPEASLRQFPLVQFHTHDELVLDFYEDVIVFDQKVVQHSARMHESLWKNHYDGQPITRAILMVALQNVRHIFVRGTIAEDFRQVVLTNVTLDAGIFVAGAENNRAFGIERCICPAQYTGLSCQDPGAGHYRFKPRLPNKVAETIDDYVGKVLPCDCNSRSSECHPETGVCLNCRNNTGGDYCQICAEGFYGDPNYGTCEPCPCPETRKNFARGCTVRDNEVSCICKPGYTGTLCESCAKGYYGSPHLEDGQCEFCECNREGSFSEECDARSGQCRCKPGITGRKCDRCELPKHIVQNYKCKPCDNCTVILIDDLNDLTIRLQEETAHIDQNGIPAPWIELELYENESETLGTAVGHLLDVKDRIVNFDNSILDNLKRNATRLNKRLNKLSNRADEFRDMTVIKALERSALLANDIRDTRDGIDQTISVLKNYGSGDQHIKLPLAIQEATDLLADIKFKYGLSRPKSEVLQCAMRQFDYWSNFSEVVDRQNSRLGDLKYEFTIFQNRMDDFDRLNREVFNNATLTESFTTKNKRKLAELEQNFERSAELAKEVEDFLDYNILAESSVQIERIKDNYQQLKQNNENLKSLNDVLEDTIKEFDQKFEELARDEVPLAIAYGKRLKEESDQYQLKFKDTEDGAANAMKASMAYENIIGAIISAQELADKATDSAKTANNKVNPLSGTSLVERSEHSMNVSTSIEKKANKELEKANELNDVMTMKEKKVESLQYHLRLAGVENNKVMEEQAAINRGDAMNKLQVTLDQANIVSGQMKFVREEAVTLNSDVYKLKLKLAKLEPEWDTKFGMAEENVSQSLGNILNAKKELHGVEKLARTQSEKFQAWNASFSAQLQELKDKIARAKHAAEGIRVSLESQDGCMRSYTPISYGPSTTNRILMSVALNSDSTESPLVYIQGEERRFIALEMYQRKIRLVWNLGDEEVVITHPTEIKPRDPKYDDAWYFIEANRTFNLCNLNVRRMTHSGVLVPANAVSGASSPEFSKLTMGPSSRIWVGGVPDELRTPELRSKQGLALVLSQLYVDQRQIGLWHFSSSSGNCGGAMLGPQESFSTSNERHFNGDGYAVLQKSSSHRSKNQFSLTLSFKTLDENALIFLALDETNNRSISLTLYQGRLVFRVDYGGDSKLEINTTNRYNTGHWVVVEAARSFSKGSTENGILKVDNKEEFRGAPTKPINSGMLPNLGNSYYLGGVPPGFKSGTTKAPGADHAFLGCLKGVQITGVSYDPLDSSKHFGIEGSCVDTISRAGFYGNGYVEFPSHSLRKRANFGFVFRTLEPNCSLLLSGFPSSLSNDFDSKDMRGNYSVFLYEGKLNLWVDSGPGRIEIVSNNTLNDGEYHVISVIKRGRTVELRIDDDFQGSKGLPKAQALVNMPGEPGGLFLGGVPDDPAFDNLSKTFVGLKGVIANVVFNNRTISFDQALNFTNVQMGRSGPPMGSHILHTALMKTEPIGHSFKTPPEGCNRVGSYSYEPNAFKYGDKPQSHSIVNVAARHIWQRNFNIQFDFRTFYPNGLMFVALGSKEKAKHFITLALRDGSLALTIRGRKREQLLLPVKLNDGQWHHVSLNSVKKKATLSVQIGNSLSSAQIKLPKKLNASNNLFVGGIPDETLLPKELQPKPEEFKGCLRKFSVNNNTQDLARPGRHLNVGQCFPRIEQGSYFPGDAYAIYKRNFNVGTFMDVDLELRTSEVNGILMSVADSINGFPAFSMEISNGNVVLSIDVGDGYPIRVQSTLPSKYTLCDNRWHNVSALYEDHQIVLRVDNYPPNTLLVQSNDVLRRVATKAPLYIGGLPDTAPSGTLLLRENFKGCIRNVVIRNERKDWTDMDNLHNVLLSECLAVN